LGVVENILNSTYTCGWVWLSCDLGVFLSAEDLGVENILNSTYTCGWVWLSCDLGVFLSAEDLGMVENILKVVSRELSAVEVMQVFKGHVNPVSRLQTGLFNFIRDKLLDGIVPGKGRRDEAVEAFLANVVPSLTPVEVRWWEVGIPATRHQISF
jgi:hypothetical protein